MNWEEPAASVRGLGDRHVDLDYDDLEEAEQDVFEERQGFLGDQDVAATAPGSEWLTSESCYYTAVDVLWSLSVLKRSL